MNNTRARLEKLISDSGMFNAGREYERERILHILQLRMECLHQGSLPWQECRNLLIYLRSHEVAST